ncbi:MAG: cystathionine beta-lyase [Sphaerospermopsis sp. SIO1G2]|nr:cystathionine beta-lyase [Sphaerospermopsis sp. SIO1G2]
MLMTHADTLLITAGRGSSAFGEVNPPTYRTSTVLFEDFDTFEAAYHGRRKPGYGRQGNPTTQALANAISALIQADYTLLTSSGLQAITLSLLAFVNQGDHIIVVDSVYGPTRAFCDHTLAKLGVETSYIPPDATIDDLHAALRENTRVVFLEAPGSLTFEMQDIRALCALAHQHDCITMLDYTWATPLYMQPLDLGVDIAIQAVTKYISGHSDVIMGAVSCREKHKAALYDASYKMGNYVSGDEASLALRGLRTMSVRLSQQYRHAVQIASFMQQQAAVARILYPPLQGDVGHALWESHMTGGAALFGIELEPSIDRAWVRSFVNKLQHIGMGFSWGGYESLLIPFQPKAIRHHNERWAHNPWCLRVHIGLEHPDDIIDDITQALAI